MQLGLTKLRTNNHELVASTHQTKRVTDIDNLTCTFQEDRCLKSTGRNTCITQQKISKNRHFRQFRNIQELQNIKLCIRNNKHQYLNQLGWKFYHLIYMLFHHAYTLTLKFILMLFCLPSNIYQLQNSV